MMFRGHQGVCCVQVVGGWCVLWVRWVVGWDLVCKEAPMFWPAPSSTQVSFCVCLQEGIVSPRRLAEKEQEKEKEEQEQKQEQDVYSRDEEGEEGDEDHQEK